MLLACMRSRGSMAALRFPDCGRDSKNTGRSRAGDVPCLRLQLRQRLFVTFRLLNAFNDNFRLAFGVAGKDIRGLGCIFSS